MEINKLLKFLIFSFLLQVSISCKENVKKGNDIITDILAVKVESKKSELKNNEVKLIDFIKDFYTSYLNDLNNSTSTCDFDKYLSEDFNKYLSHLDYDGIIHAQDYEEFNLNTLKVSKTEKDNIYKVVFINMGYETIVYVRVKLINKTYKITNISSDFKEADVDIVPSKLRTHEYDFDIFFSYYIEPVGDPKTAITYVIEDFDDYTTVFKKESYDNAFEYECTKQKKDNTLQLFHKTTTKGEDYNSNKPLITIYKQNNAYYAISPIIENGQEIKLTKE